MMMKNMRSSISPKRDKSPVNLDLPIRFNQPSNANLHGYKGTMSPPAGDLTIKTGAYNTWLDMPADSRSGSPVSKKETSPKKNKDRSKTSLVNSKFDSMLSNPQPMT